MAVSPNFDSNFLEMMPETVTLTPVTGTNANNEPTYGSAVSYQARVTGKILMLRSFTGEEVTSVFTVYLNTIDQVLSTDKLTLTGSEWGNDLTPLIFTINRVTDENSHSYVQLSCGWMYHRQGS
jgi:hypothetical protein